MTTPCGSFSAVFWFFALHSLALLFISWLLFNCLIVTSLLCNIFYNVIPAQTTLRPRTLGISQNPPTRCSFQSQNVTGATRPKYRRRRARKGYHRSSYLPLRTHYPRSRWRYHPLHPLAQRLNRQKSPRSLPHPWRLLHHGNAFDPRKCYI